MFNRLKTFIQTHERALSAGALFTGFIWDTLTLTRVDYLFEVVVLGSHISLVIVWIFLINLHDGGLLRFQPFSFLRRIAPILMQFSFGALFSGLLVFYSKSASLSMTLVYLGVFVLLLIGNEFFRGRYQRLVFQLSILFIAIASLAALYMPVITGSVAAWVFVTASILALIFILAFAAILHWIVPERVRPLRGWAMLSLGTLFVGLQFLYFANIVPPVPLALKERGVYHDIQRVNDQYRVVGEERTLFDWLTPEHEMHVYPSEPVFVFTSIFAPTNLNTQVAHVWEQYDSGEDTWVAVDRIPYSITGGRDNGFRGYTQKSFIVPGKWRVSVVTQRDQVLGRVYFEVKIATTPPSLFAEFI